MLTRRKDQLEAEFSADQLYTRQVKNDVLTYIHHSAVIERLNQVYGHGNWSFECLDVQFLSQEIVVKGQLQVPKATYSQFGCFRSQGQTFSTGEAIKAAASNSLMRCAIMLGVGLYLRNKQAPEDDVVAAHSEAELMSQRQNNYLLQIMKNQNLSTAEVDQFCQHHFGCSREHLNKQQASQLIGDLNKGLKIPEAA